MFWRLYWSRSGAGRKEGARSKALGRCTGKKDTKETDETSCGIPKNAQRGVSGNQKWPDGEVEKWEADKKSRKNLDAYQQPFRPTEMSVRD